MQNSEHESGDHAKDQNDEWIVQSKSKRLVPQQGLASPGTEADKAKAAAAIDPKKKAPVVVKKEDASPRPVIRYTKEEMLTFRQYNKPMLKSMTEMNDVISTEKLNPVCFERLDPEDVIRIWNADKSNQNKQNVEAAGRGRGRGKFGKEDGEGGDHVPGDWSTARGDGGSGKRDLWDDGKGSGSANNGAGNAFDLSDFAAMSQKFRDEMHEMKLKGVPGVEIDAPVEDTMERLLREQKGLGGLGDEEEEDMPDWATEAPAKSSATTTTASNGARSLLLDTLNVKRESAPAAAVPAPQASYSAMGGLDVGSILGSSLLGGLTGHHALASPPAPQPAPTAVLLDFPPEWFYTDPQGTVQGPFEQENMRQWNEAGYFSGDLPIKLRSWARFHQFVVVFPDQKNAFTNIAMEPGTNPALYQQQQALLVQREREQREKEQREKEQREREAREAHEAQIRKQQQEAAERAAAERAALEAEQRRQRERELEAQRLLQAQQAQQLQILKEQAAREEQQRAARERAAAEAAAAQHEAGAASPTKQSTVAPWANKTGTNKSEVSSLANIQNEQKVRADAEQQQRNTERKKQQAEQAKITKGWQAPAASSAAPSLAEIQEEEARARQSGAPQSAGGAAPATSAITNTLKNLLGVGRINPAAVAAAHPQPSTSAPWSASSGAAAAGPSGGARSLKDIMQEESQQSGSASPAPAGASSSGAADAPAPVVRKGPSSWASKAGSNVPANYVAPTPATAPAPVAAAPASAPKKPVVSLSSISQQPNKPAATAAPAASSSTAAEFGGNKEMRKELADWCAAQLKRINGSEDITLMQFVYTVDDAAEIREYLSSYLGSSPQVTNFATDFIKYKSGGKIPAGALDSGAAQTSGAPSATQSAATGNSNGVFVSANKKKGGKPAGGK